MQRNIWLAVVVVITTLSGCSTWNKLDQKERGAVIGAGSGGVIGGAVTGGSAGGALLGGAVGAVGGGLIGNEMDKDRK